MCRCEASQPPKSKILKIQQVDKKKFWDSSDHSTSIGALKSRNGPFLRKNIFVTFSYINVWVKFDPDFSYLISYLNFLYIFHKFLTSVLERFQTPIHQNFGMGMFLGLLRCVLIPKISGLAHWVGYYGVCCNSFFLDHPAILFSMTMGHLKILIKLPWKLACNMPHGHTKQQSKKKVVTTVLV